MMPASKHGDPQLGIDIHPCVVPPSPSPVPLPTPHMSIVFDPFDYLPFIGTTITVCGMKRANAGTNGMSVHIPPGFPFAPKLPDKDDELFMGSMTVTADGDPFSFIAVPVLSCQLVGMPGIPRLKKKGAPKLMLLPTTFNLAIPTNVFIGGPPIISIMGMLGKLGFAALGKFARSGLFKRMRKKMFGKMKPGFLKCKVLRAEPVDILSGEVSVEHEDFVLPGRIPVQWARTYGSSRRRHGLCGHGWETMADARLEVDPWTGVVSMHHPVAGPLHFARLPKGQGEAAAELEMVDGAWLSDAGSEYRVRAKDHTVYAFPKRLFSTRSDGTQEFALEGLSDLCGNSLQIERRGGVPVAIRESAGRRVELVHEQGRISEIRMHIGDDQPPHVFVRYAYDAAGDLVSVIDALGQPYRFAYDEHHMVRHTNRTGLSFFYEYDKEAPGDWRVVHSWGDGALYAYRFAYDDMLRERRITDSLGHVSLVKLDERGLPISEIDALGGITIFEYDGGGRTIGITDPCGHRSSYDYDECGNLLGLTLPDESRIENEFDRANQIVATTDADGTCWRQEWDERSLLTARISPLGNTFRYEHDTRGQLVSLLNPRGARTRFGYDAFGNLSSVEDALGHRTTFAHDALGNVTLRTDPLGHSIEYCYDIKGRLTRIRSQTGSTVHAAYDAENNLVEQVDENGAIHRFEYFGQGEIAKHTQADGQAVLYCFDTEERLSSVTNKQGQRYRLRRDPLGRIIEEVDYWGQSKSYVYDASGHLKQRIDALGHTIFYQTDALGRIVKKSLLDHEGGAATFEESFEFDRAGNLVAAENDHVRVERRFDKDQRLIEEKQGQHFVVCNAFDAAGNRTRREAEIHHGPRNEVYSVDFEYDLLNQPVQISAPHHEPIRIRRDAMGSIIHEALSSRVQRDTAYDPDGQLTHQRLIGVEGRSIVELAYIYDAAGNVLERHDSEFGNERFEYDELDRIVNHVDLQASPAAMGGSRRLPTWSAAFGAAGELENGQGTRAPGSWLRRVGHRGASYRFDRVGNLIEREDERGKLQLVWDANRRLVESRSGPHELQTRYGYDPMGRRVFKSGGGKTTLFFWDGDALAGDVLLETANEDGAPIRSRHWIYRPGTFVPVAMIVAQPDAKLDPHDRLNQRLYLYQNDPNGCPQRLITPEGRMAWSALYDAWGSCRRLREIEIENPLRFQGQYFDEETELHYNRNRYYCPRGGCFVQMDPLGLLAGEDLYQYAPNALSWSDPLGLDCKFKMQPYRYSDVRVKGPHGDVIKDGLKITEGRLSIKDNALAWQRFGDMGKASKRDLAEADRLLKDLLSDQTVMNQARQQVDAVIGDLTRDLTHKNKATREMAKRQLEYFEKMRGLF